jgi:hypothetical protein
MESTVTPTLERKAKELISSRILKILKLHQKLSFEVPKSHKKPESPERK